MEASKSVARASCKLQGLIVVGFFGFVLLVWTYGQLQVDVAAKPSAATAAREALSESSRNVAEKAITPKPARTQRQTFSDSNKVEQSREARSPETTVSKIKQPKELEWIILLDCAKSKAVNCEDACSDRGLKCDAEKLKPLDNKEKLQQAVLQGGGKCAKTKSISYGGAWDGPYVQDDTCTYNSNSGWTPSCFTSPACNMMRLCPCVPTGIADATLKARKKYKTIRQKPIQWWDIPARVPAPIKGDWNSETMFLDGLLRSFGKLRSNYGGPQRLMGFKYGKIFDDDGMFAFEDSVKSVAFDVGAATNPLVFDLPIDDSQVAFLIEPVQWKSIEQDFDREARAFDKQGGCKKFWNAGICSREKALVFPAAVSETLGHAIFHVTGNPYCGSLEAFTADKNKSAIANSLRNSKDPEVRGIFEACYKDIGQNRKVATISLKSILERIPKRIAIKTVKIDAQGHDFKVLLSAGDQISRIQYTRFEMQVDPPEGRRLVKDIPSYAEVKAQLEKLGFKHDGAHACFFDGGASPFSKFVMEKECVFCRLRPCQENGRPPLGPNPGKKSIMKINAEKPYIKPRPWEPPAAKPSEELVSSNVQQKTPETLGEVEDQTRLADTSESVGGGNSEIKNEALETASDKDTSESESTDSEKASAPDIEREVEMDSKSENTVPSTDTEKALLKDDTSTGSSSDGEGTKPYIAPKEPSKTVFGWDGVAKAVPVPTLGDWNSETLFLERVFRVFGKQRSEHKGFQKMGGFKPGMIFDENGMFAFDDTVKSIAFDVGAATNPLTFDLDIDSSQIAFYVEPYQWKTLEEDLRLGSAQLKKRGRGMCTTKWDPACVMNRFFIWPAAVSEKLGHAKFHATANPYCGSLESFIANKNNTAVTTEITKNKDKEISGIFEACYKDAGVNRRVATISLKALLDRIPKDIIVKYVKIDAQGHDYKVLLSAGDQISRIQYARFEMQVDPPPDRKLVHDIPSYDEVKAHLASLGFKHNGQHACYSEGGAFSKAVKEMECVFCRKLPCKENAVPPLGRNPRETLDK